jgi:membrane-bound lytic murein transglycosylase B
VLSVALAAALPLGAGFGLSGGLALWPAGAQAQETLAKRAPDPQGKDSPAERPYADRDDVKAFATLVSQRHGMALDWVLGQLEPARRLPQVQRLIMPAPAGTARNWTAYRARFVEPRRIEPGVRFWQTHEDALQRAQARWGVPAELIVGIIGVETLYGRHTGGFRTLDALATLAFDFPPGRRDRSAFFRDELEELLLIARREEVDAASFLGSYAGAQGLPQFMPSSIRRWAVDFDGDGHVDLRTNPVDAIGSVANYLAAFGWKAGMPTHYRVTPPREPAALARLLAPDIVPTFTAAEFTAEGALLSRDGRRHVGPLALVALENGDDDASYVAGTRNFYVVTRYNWSSYYALAVIELGQAVARARTGSVARGR